ncbi:hypothetical protein GCM10027418_30430 [Mariniluteicoccus endophyticus]
MLDVAVAQIEAEGMSVGLDGIRMERVIEAAGVSRATAYRRWPTRDAFLTDVLVETVRRTSLIPEAGDDLARLVALVSEHHDALTTPQGRRDLVVEGLRVSVDMDVHRIMESPRWRTFLSLSATYPSLPHGEVREAVGRALAATEDDFSRRRAEVYANLATLIGYRLVPPLKGEEGFRVLGGAAGAVMRGIITRANPDPGWLDRRTGAALFGASRATAWSEPERYAVAMLLAHLEPDPDLVWDAATVAALLERFETQIAEMYATAASE